MGTFMTGKVNTSAVCNSVCFCCSTKSTESMSHNIKNISKILQLQVNCVYWDGVI